MELLSTRDRSLRATFAEAVRGNLPADGGLYLPAALQPFADMPELLAQPWSERARTVVSRLLAPELSAAESTAIADAAFDFPVPRVEIAPGLAALELFHGPTLSFKDFGVRFLAQTLAFLRRRDGEAQVRTVLTATSGDTGAAVARAFWRLPGFRAVVLYPRGRVSPLQERQFATLGENVRAFAVEGSFDDCQDLVKACFADADLARELGLLSANSINVARLIAQVLYYLEAVALRRHGPDSTSLPRPGPESPAFTPWAADLPAFGRRAPESTAPLVISVPSGNFGNLCAGLIAQRLGAPIAALVAATNANATVPEYLEHGLYVPRASVATLSNAMDVGAPNNWQRIAFLFDDDWRAMRAALRWGSASDTATRAALSALAALGYAADPHGAVAYEVLRRALRPGEDGLFMATAHPAKFEATFDSTQPLPPGLAEVASRPLLSEPLAVDAAELRRSLRRWS